MVPTPIKLHFDGGCRPNPGPMETAVVLRGESHIRTSLSVGGNDEAEWLALIHAAEIAVAAGLTDVVFVGDSALVINQARGVAKCRRAAFATACARFHDLTASIPSVRLRHVPRTKNLAGIALERRHSGLAQSRPAAASRIRVEIDADQKADGGSHRPEKPIGRS